VRRDEMRVSGLEIEPLGPVNYLEQRPSYSILDLLKNPMVRREEKSKEGRNESQWV
jgi:hypothetical protein